MNEHDSIEKILLAERAPLSGARPSSDQLLARLMKRHRRRQRMRAGIGLSAVLVAVGTAWSILPLEPVDIRPAGNSPAQEMVNLTAPTMLASDPDPNGWFIGVGPRDASGLYPVMMINESSRTMVPMGTIHPPVVKELSVWQLPGDVREEVLTNWAEAGHAVVHEL